MMSVTRSAVVIIVVLCVSSTVANIPGKLDLAKNESVSSTVNATSTRKLETTKPSYATENDNATHNQKELKRFLTLMKALQDLEHIVFDTEIDKGENIIGKVVLGVMITLNPLDNTKYRNGTCVSDLKRLLVGFLDKENWAVQFFDATGKPGPSLTLGRLNFVGNYRQCTSATAPIELSAHGESVGQFHGGYFLITVMSSSIPVSVRIGACLPDTCSEKEVESLGKQMIVTANVSISITSVHQLTDNTNMTSATVAAIIVFCVIGLIVILGTVFDLVHIQFPAWYGTNKVYGGENRSMMNGEQSTKTIPEAKTIVGKILVAFSVYSNGKKILETSQTSGFIQSIHGIRFFSITWVILAHTFAFTPMYAINTGTAYSEFMNRWTIDVIANSFTCVDTFFTLSGLLTSYLTMEHLLKKGIKLNWPLFYFHRFWRLTPPYMLVLLFYLGFQQYFIQGPLRNFEQPIDKNACEKHWWANLLYINNLIYNKQGEICLGHTWYMSIDMQFFILSPLMMLPFCFHRVAGLCCCLVFLLSSWIVTGVLSTINQWPPTGPNLKQALRGVQNDAWLYDYYVKPWCRIGPFVIGIVAGYILRIHKDKRLVLKRGVVALGWIVASASAMAIVYGLRGDITGNDPSSIGASALYNSVARSVWGACVSWVIIACSAGYGGPVNVLLSWSPFVMLGRLSYTVYLIHVPLVFIFYQNLDQLFYMNDTTIVVYFLGIWVASNMAAFILMLALESPMIGLAKAILRGKRCVFNTA